MIIEKPFYLQRVTVWCGFWVGRIIGPYFFENEAGATVSVNVLRYRTMINRCLWPELEDMNVDDVYLQQDGATWHTSGETIGLLCEKFPGRVISRNGDYNWPPRSCDLTPLDFFHWGYVKSVNSRTQREDSYRYRRNRCNGKFHEKSMVLQT